MPKPHNAGDAAKAYRLRKAIERGQVLKPTDRLWLDEYEHDHPKSAKDYGRSRSARKVRLEIDEAAEAEGEGENPATVAAAAAMQTREEGRRLDQLTVHALAVYEKCVEGYERQNRSMRLMLRAIQRPYIDMMESVREHYLARAQTEGQLQRLLDDKENEGDPVNALMAYVAARHLGVPLDQLPGVAKIAADAMAQQQGKGGKPKPNGQSNGAGKKG